MAGKGGNLGNVGIKPPAVTHLPGTAQPQPPGGIAPFPKSDTTKGK